MLQKCDNGALTKRPKLHFLVIKTVVQVITTVPVRKQIKEMQRNTNDWLLGLTFFPHTVI